MGNKIAHSFTTEPLVGINAFLSKENKIVSENIMEALSKPSNPIFINDLNKVWEGFLTKIKYKSPSLGSMLEHISIDKSGDVSITINFPSKSIKNEFRELEPDFINELKQATNNHLISVEHRVNELAVDIDHKKLDKNELLERIIKKNNNILTLIKALNLKIDW